MAHIINYTWKEFEEDISYFKAIVEANRIDSICTLYRGGLPLGVTLSNRCNLPLSILDYQSYDGDSKEVTIMKNNKLGGNILLVDDLVDTANTIFKAEDLLENYGTVTVCTIHGQKKYKKSNGWLYCREKEDSWYSYPWE